MPFRSLQQKKWFLAHKKQLEAKGVNVGEWLKSTGKRKLPNRVKSKKNGKR